MKYVVIFMLVAMTSAPAHADCASTVDSFVARMMDLQMKEAFKDEKMTPEMRKMAEDMVKEMKPKLTVAMTTSCINDAWSSGELKCLDDATDDASADKCERLLTAQQKASLDRAMSKAMGMDAGDPTRCQDASVAAELVLGVRSIPRSSSKSQAQHRRDAADALGRKIADLCITDRWADETISCMKSASSLTDVVTCRQQLAGDAVEHLQAAEMAALGPAVDCVKTTGRAIDRVEASSAKDVDARMKWVFAETCSADWWSTSSLTCIDHAKTAKAMKGCEAKLTRSQRADLTAVMTYAMGTGEAVSDASLPKECVDYGAVIERLATCDKMPEQSRDALRNAYREASAGWKDLPPDVKANLASACKAGRDAVFESGKSLCGW